MMLAITFQRLNRVVQRWYVVGLVAIFVAASVFYSIKVLTPRNGAHTRSAIVRWREPLLNLDAGENIYTRYTYPNPPIMALILRPIAELPPLTGALVWFYLKVAMTLLTIGAVFRLVESPGLTFPPWAKIVAVLLSLRPIVGDLMHGNVNLLILFLVVASLYLFHRGRDVSAGIVLGLAIACKVTPALFVPYFLWKRAWWMLAGCALGLALFFLIVPALFLGWEQNLEWLRSWIDQMVKPYLLGAIVTSEHQNQSLPGLIYRLVTPSASFSTYVEGVYTPLQFHNWLVLSPTVAAWLIKGFFAVFAGLVILTCRTPTRIRTGWRLTAEYGLILLGMLLFSERTWKHHCVTLLVPFAVLSYRLFTAPFGRPRQLSIALVLLVVTLFLSTTSTEVLPDDWAKLAQVYGAYVAAYLLLIAATTRMLLESRHSPAVDYNPSHDANAGLSPGLHRGLPQVSRDGRAGAAAS